jgi:CRP/FNR family transcriptional regulator, cyclic AMP receptor protein
VTPGVGIHERIELLRTVWLFAECTDDELGRIASLAHVRPAAPGTVIVKQGDPGEEFYVVLDGNADVTIDGDLVEAVGPGAFFGEMALIDGGERAATVTATSAVQLLILERTQFNEMIEVAMPSIAARLLSVVGSRSRVRDEHEGRPVFGY